MPASPSTSTIADPPEAARSMPAPGREGPPARTASVGGRGAPLRRPDDLVEGAQQPQPAQEADPLTLLSIGARLGFRHQPEAAGGRVGLVQADADLHASIIAGPPGADIGQLADVSPPPRSHPEHIHHQHGKER
jgi:hypothetical protein